MGKKKNFKMQMDAVIKYGVGGDCSHRFGRLQYIFFNFFLGGKFPQL